MARRTCTVSEPRLRQQTQRGRVSQNLTRGLGSPESAHPQHQVPLFPGHTGNLSLLTCQLQLLLTPSSGSLFLEKAMATHFSILAWRILWMEEPGGLLPIGSHRVGELACMHALEKEITTHFSTLPWRVPGREDPGGLLSMGWHRVRHD